MVAVAVGGSGGICGNGEQQSEEENGGNGHRLWVKKAQLLNGVLRIQVVWEFMTVVEGEDKEENVHLQGSRKNV